MRIKRINIQGFGCLSDRVYEFPADKAVLVLESNESGKSTLAAAIIAGLCGFPKRKGSGEAAKLKDIYRPWGGDVYALEMEIEAGGKDYLVKRNFAADRFNIWDSETNQDVSAQFNSDLTSHFLKLPREDFSRVAVISGKEAHRFSSSPNIQARLSALFDGSQDDNSGEIAISALENAKYTLDRPLTIANAIKRLTQAVEERQSTLRELDMAMEEAQEDAQALETARADKQKLSEELSRLDDEYKAATLRDVRRRIAELKENSDDVNQLERELAELAKYSQFPVERSAQLTKTFTRIDEIELTCKTLLDRLERAQQDAAEIQNKLEDSECFAAATQDDLLLLGSYENSLRAAGAEAARKESQLDVLKANLANEGLNIDSCVKQWQKFECLSFSDKDFLRDYRENSLKSEAEISQAETEEADLKSKLRDVQRRRKTRYSIGISVLVTGGLAGFLSVILMILRLLPFSISLAGVIAGAAVAAAGGSMILRAKSAASNEEYSLKSAAEDAHTQAVLAQDRHKTLNTRLAEFAERLQFEPDVIVEAFKQAEKAADRCSSLDPISARLAQIQESMESTRNRAYLLLRRLGIDYIDRDLTELLSNAQQELSAYLQLRERFSGVRLDISSIERQVEQANARLSEEKAIATEILEDAGVEKDLPLNEAMRQFAEMEKHFRRYKQIKEALLPSAAKHTSDETLARLLEQEGELALDVGITATDSAKSPVEIENDRLSARNRLQQITEIAADLEKNVGAKVEAYKKNCVRLREELANYESQLEKASRFKSAIDIAAEVMREVCAQSRRKWATALNNRASAILPHLNNKYDDLRFDDAMAFTVRDRSNSRIIQKSEVDSCLSTGAKDQVYLAVRLACCRELSASGEALPIILDDPLMASDDSRFTSGFKFLADNLPQHQQVIILSCHESRHKNLYHLPWFAENVCVISL